MRRPLVSVTDGTRRPSGTVVREWHRLACSASGTGVTSYESLFSKLSPGEWCMGGRA